ncbi:MAG TPA: DUF2845 domain-containing protein [Pseudomonas sp.]|jgi:hypothetical protein|nr:DUF2845 domain-containing protein [Pseudomonas sp.]
MGRLLFAALLLAPMAEASSTLRCGSELISLGDTAWEVLRKCGEPADRSQQGLKLQRDEQGLRYDVGVEEWLYGPRNGMYHLLRFEGGRLRNIRSERDL